MKNPPSPEPELATGWPITRVQASLQSAKKNELIAFLEKRYEERFFEPIRVLKTSRGHYRGFGFAIMALCSLLIESLQSYRYGLPTTHAGELDDLLSSCTPPAEYVIREDERKSGRRAFKDFFLLPAHKQLFPDVDGLKYYDAIRNGLLHQAQTKGGWRIRTGEARIWSDNEKIVDRTKFADALEAAFELYVDELNSANWADDIWIKARRKIWWLIELSS